MRYRIVPAIRNMIVKQGQGTMGTLELSSKAMASAIVPASEKLLYASSSFVNVACVYYFEVYNVLNDIDWCRCVEWEDYEILLCAGLKTQTTIT